MSDHIRPFITAKDSALATLENPSFTEDSLPPSLNISHLFMRFRYKLPVLISTLLPILKTLIPTHPHTQKKTFPPSLNPMNHHLRHHHGSSLFPSPQLTTPAAPPPRPRPPMNHHSLPSVDAADSPPSHPGIVCQLICMRASSLECRRLRFPAAALAARLFLVLLFFSLLSPFLSFSFFFLSVLPSYPLPLSHSPFLIPTRNSDSSRCVPSAGRLPPPRSPRSFDHTSYLFARLETA